MVVDLHHCFLHKATVLEKCPKNREGFCLGCKKLMAIHAKIDALNRAVEDLLEEERQLSPTLNDYHDPFTTRLPVEIASSIMYLSLPASPSLQIFHRGFEEKRHIRALVNLGLVSGNWRRISRGEPKLWTILPITIGGGIDPGTSWIREWIERAGGLDLFVRIAMNVPRSSYLERIIPLLIPHTHRWKVLALDMPQPPASLLLSALSSLELCRLDNFMLHIWYHQEPSGIPLGLKASPSTLTIDSDSLDLVTFGWSRLTQITVASIPSLYQCFQIFQDAPSLTHCELAGVSHEGDIWPYDRSINHSSLEFLSPGSCVSEFWNLFTFPSLTTLHLLHITDVSSFLVWPCFEGFLRRSASSLTELVVGNLAASRQNPENHKVIDILTRLPNLERFTLDGGSLRRSFFSALKAKATTSNDQKFLSKLTTVKLTNPVIRSSSDLSELLAFAQTITPRLNQPYLGIKLAEPRFSGRVDKNRIALPKAFYQSMMDLTEVVDLSIINKHDQTLDLHRLIYCDDFVARKYVPT